MKPEKRNARATIHKAGGTAGKPSVTYSVKIPNSWAKRWGLTTDDRQLQLSFNGDEITIRKSGEAQEREF